VNEGPTGKAGKHFLRASDLGAEGQVILLKEFIITIEVLLNRKGYW
jgi:hypothetical protein